MCVSVRQVQCPRFSLFALVKLLGCGFGGCSIKFDSIIIYNKIIGSDPVEAVSSQLLHVPSHVRFSHPAYN